MNTKTKTKMINISGNRVLCNRVIRGITQYTKYHLNDFVCNVGKPGTIFLDESINFTIERLNKPSHNFIPTCFSNNLEMLNLERYFRLVPKHDLKGKKPETITDLELQPRDFNLVNVSFVDILMFGSCRITISMLDILLELVRYSQNKYHYSHYYLDHYDITNPNDNCVSKIYENEEQLKILPFTKGTYEKRMVAWLMIHLMNKVPQHLINWHNYNVIVQYYKTHFPNAKYYNNLIDNRE